MLKKINRVLRLVGLNLVRAKRRNVKAGYRSHVPIEDANTGPRPHPHPFNDGKTHYVGDDCPGGHLDCAADAQKVGVDNHEMTRVEQPNSDNKISGPTS